MLNITWGDCSDSEFLKKDDIVQDGEVVTIEAFEKKTVKGNGNEPDKQKVCCKFEEHDKWLVVNSTNANALSAMTQSPSPTESIGKKIEMYVDPYVTFGGKVVGGIRFKPFTEIPY